MFYFLNFEYLPNTAVGNRLLGYYRSMDKMGIEAEVVFLHPNSRYEKIQESFNSIKFVYYWKRYIPYRGVFRNITLQLYLKRFLSNLKSGDIVYTYSISKLTTLCEQVPGVRVFAERTEHPDASHGFPHPLLSLSKDDYISTVKRLDGLFVISEPLKNFYSSIGIESSKIEIINMTVDPSRFENLQKDKTVERYIAYCGNASNNKDGVDELIKSFALVASKIADIKLYIIGNIPTRGQRFENLDLVKTLGIEERVTFTGLVNAESMPQLLKNAEILALDRPDNIQAHYGFPTKLGEYLLTKNPVVITTVGDIPKFLQNGKSAFLANPNDTRDFSEKLLFALTHRKEAIQIGENGYAVAMQFFNSFTETSKILKFIKNKLNHE